MLSGIRKCYLDYRARKLFERYEFLSENIGELLKEARSIRQNTYRNSHELVVQTINYRIAREELERTKSKLERIFLARRGLLDKNYKPK